MDPKAPGKTGTLVTSFDDVQFKSSFGGFLSLQDTDDFLLKCENGINKNDQLSVFRIVKAGVPFLPDWLFTRPNLTHNVGIP